MSMITKTSFFSFVAMAVVGCADQTGAPSQTAAAPGTAILCDGTVFNLARTLTDAEIQAFAGTWRGQATGISGRFKGCVDDAVQRENTLTDSSLRVKYGGSGHSCGQGTYENTTVLPFATRLKGDGFYNSRNGRQWAMFLNEVGQLRVVSDTARSRTCWSQTLERVE